MENLIDSTDARLLDLLQAGVPLVSRPFDELGRALEESGQAVIERVARLKSAGAIRQIGGVFDSAALGYRSTLVAFRVRQDMLDSVAESVARHDGVSHCYGRDNEWNLWFTLTVPPEGDLDREIAGLAGAEGVLGSMNLPAVRVFKIGVFLKLGEEAQPGPVRRGGRAEKAIELTEVDRAAVRALQEDLPLVEEPFADLAAGVGLSEDDLLARGRAMLAGGTMRRFAAVLRHRQVGYSENAMICWNASAAETADIGPRLAGHYAVSHCYERPTNPSWPWSLYTMVHARSAEELAAIIQELTDLSGGLDHAILATVREYKKVRVKYLREA